MPPDPPRTAERQPEGGWRVWGQRRPVAQLRQALRTGRVAHAYLFAGPEGVGKRRLALDLAKALLCTDARNSGLATGCGRCGACRRVERNVHPDLETYSLASQAEAAERTGGRNTGITIETARQVRASTALRPMEGDRRIIVVDEAETMQEAAQEALLKTLEEPPPSVVLILLSTDVDALLPTIRSRCRLVELGLVEASTIAAGLERDGVTAERAARIARLAQGRPGWAVRAAADEALVGEREAAVERAIAWIASSPYDRLVTAVRLGDGFAKRRGETFSELETALGVWRDALLVQLGLPERAVFGDHVDRLRRFSSGWNAPAVLAAIDAVQSCLSDLEANVRPRLAIEAMVLRWPIPTHP